MSKHVHHWIEGECYGMEGDPGCGAYASVLVKKLEAERDKAKDGERTALKWHDDIADRMEAQYEVLTLVKAERDDLKAKLKDAEATLDTMAELVRAVRRERSLHDLRYNKSAIADGCDPIGCHCVFCEEVRKLP